MTITWDQYCRWAHESGTRKAGPDTPESERAALFHIWAHGLAGEFLEMMLEDEQDGTVVPGQKLILEMGDVVFYLARMYVDTGNAFRGRQQHFHPFAVCWNDVVRGVKDIVECVKKAFRAEGDKGLVRLCVSETEQFYALDPAKDKAAHMGRREEFGVLLDRALSAFEAWLVERGTTLSAVCEANVEKLVKRRKEGLISAQGERVSELGRAVKPEDLAPAASALPCGTTSQSVGPSIFSRATKPVSVRTVSEDAFCEKCGTKPCAAREAFKKIVTTGLVWCSRHHDSHFPSFECAGDVRPPRPGSPVRQGSDPVRDARLARADLDARTLPTPKDVPEIPNPKRSG